MKLLPFKESKLASLGIELEFQIIHPNSFSLVSKSKELLRNIRESTYQEQIKPEITQSMIEINSSIHDSASPLFEEIKKIQTYLIEQANEINVLFCGGGTHPFQKWSVQKIFPTMRYKRLSQHYRYLSKRSTVFGQHIHVGCKNGDDALYLTHALTRYIPQLVAMSTASPYYQGVDTGYHSTRLTIFTGFPSSGVIPYLTNWKEFSEYYYKMVELGIIESMKDLYWDIRPKPEFGTVELRICDTPLTLERAVMLAAYTQALSLYLLEERPFKITPNFYHVYHYNRFQACRYGFDSDFIDPVTYNRIMITDDILHTIKKIEHYANQLNGMPFVSRLMEIMLDKNDDASLLRNIFKIHNSFPKLVQEQCKIWAKP